MPETKLTAYLKTALLASLVVLACTLTLCGVQAYFFISATRTALLEDPRGITGILANTNAILVQVGATTSTIRKASEQQSQYWKEMSKEGITTLKKSNATLSETSLLMQDLRRDGREVVDGASKATVSLTKLLNSADEVVARAGGGVLPRVEANLDASRMLFEKSANAVEQTGESIEQIVLTSNSLLRLPAWTESANNLANTTGNISLATGNVAQTTGYIKDAFMPSKKTFWSNLTSQLLPSIFKLAVPASSVIWNSPSVNVQGSTNDTKK